MVNVEWQGQDYLHLMWHVVCSRLATPDVETYLRALGVKRWRIKALDRTEWSAILRESKDKLQGP